jgi:23S rRNA (adenine2503-C2)-methyltransferase
VISVKVVSPSSPNSAGRILNIKGFSSPVLRERFRRAGIPAYRADQVFHWLYRRGVEDFAAMTNLDLELRRQLAERWQTRALSVLRVQESRDGTCKLALGAVDGAVVEAVLIPEERRNTLCISTQVGCPLACSFCATGARGFDRNLSTAEIVDQVFLATKQDISAGEPPSNVVFMGMGEPLLNLPSVLEAIRILTDPKGLAMAPRRITVSTVGVIPKIRPLLEVGPINLAVSLHATTDRVRDELVAINRHFPLGELLRSLRENDLISPRRPVFFEYVLVDGVNDSPEDARRLPGLLRAIPCKVNVIPLNAHADSPYRAPPREVVDRFTADLHRAGLRVTLRRSRGADIDAACGQLAPMGYSR